MSGPNSKRPSSPFPKAGALKPSVAGTPNSKSNGPVFKENTSSYDAGAALKLREPLPEEDPNSAKDQSLFASLYAPETQNRLALVDPDEKTTPLTRSRSKTEKDLQDGTAKPGGSSIAKNAIEPTLSPSAIGHLKDQLKKPEKKSLNSAVTEVSDPRLKKSREKTKKLKPGESIHDAETRVTRVSRTTAEQRAARADAQTGVTVNGGYQRRPRAQEESESERSPVPLILIAIVAIGALYFVMNSSAPSRSLHHQSKFSEEEEKALVQMHRYETGSDLNNGRNAVEYKNMQTAPALSADATKIKTGTMMDGLPLQQENNMRTNARDRLEAANPNDPDHRVEYILQDEQQAQAWEQQAQKEYVREFVKNAQDAGYQVRIHDNLDIDVRRAPKATGGGPGGSQGSGGFALPGSSAAGH